jgi:hypothetical protein
MSIITKKSLIAAGIFTALIAGNMAMAADVPAGVTLAEKQTMMLSKKNSEALENFSEKLEVEGRSLWQDARRRFMHNRAAVTSLFVLVLIALFVTLAPMMTTCLTSLGTFYSNGLKK